MEPITLERSIWIAAPRERVWLAVTEASQIAQWFATGVELTQEGDIISARIGDQLVAVAVIEVNDPPQQVTTRSLPDRILTTTYRLDEENGGTRFTVIEAGFESLSEADRKTRFQQDGDGWEAAIANLHAYLEGRALPRPEGF
jgi:uncharacterized protein YndB with AHSA1/START domain